MRPAHLIAASALLALFGCQPEPQEGGPTPPGTTSPTPTQTDPCDQRMATADPVDGATEVPLDTDVRFSFTDSGAEADAATITVKDGTTEVPGSTAWDGAALVFTPDADLRPDTTYDVALGWSCGPSSTSFTTELPVPDTAWSASLDGGTFVQPAGVGPLIAPLLVDTPLLVELLGQGTDSVDLRMAQGSGVQQARCAETVEALGTDYSMPPSIEVDIAALLLDAQGVPMVIEDALFTADLDPVMGTLSNVSLTGSVNVGTLDPLVGGDTCGLLAAFGAICTTCPTGGDTCVDAEITAIPTAPWVGTLQERTAYDIANDAQCP